jgi:uncharacterized protein YdgA (DUF945 family)
MRRALLILAPPLVLAALGLPWWLGGRAEQVYEQTLSRLPNQGLTVVASHYDRGWFSSRASAELALTRRPRPEAGTAPLTVHVESRVHHGPWSLTEPRLQPVGAVVESRAGFGPEGKEPPLLRAETLMELDGETVSQLRIPAIGPSQTRGGGKIRVAEGTGEVRFSPDPESGQAWLELPEAELSADAGEVVRLRAVRIEGKGSRGPSGLLDGQGQLKAGEVSVEGPAGNFCAAGVSVVGESHPERGLLFLHGEYRVADLVINGARYAPWVLEASVHRLDGPALVSLQRALNDFPQSGADPATQAASAAAIFASHLPPILAAGPSLTLDRLDMGTPEGPITGHLSLSVQAVTRDSLRQRVAWLTRLAGEADLAVPEPLLRRLMTERRRRQLLAELRKQDPAVTAVPAEYESQLAHAAAKQLDGLVRQGWVTRGQGRIIARIKLADGLLTINGKTFPLAPSALHFH